MIRIINGPSKCSLLRTASWQGTPERAEKLLHEVSAVLESQGMALNHLVRLFRMHGHSSVLPLFTKKSIDSLGENNCEHVCLPKKTKLWRQISCVMRQTWSVSSRRLCNLWQLRLCSRRAWSNCFFGYYWSLSIVWLEVPQLSLQSQLLQSATIQINHVFDCFILFFYYCCCSCCVLLL